MDPLSTRARVSSTTRPLQGIGARLSVLSPDGTPLLVLPAPTMGRLVGCSWHEARLYVSEIEAHRIHVFRIID